MIFRKSHVLNQCQTTSINCKPYKCSILKIIYFAFLLSRKDPIKFNLLYTRLEFCTMGAFLLLLLCPQDRNSGAYSLCPVSFCHSIIISFPNLS